MPLQRMQESCATASARIGVILQLLLGSSFALGQTKEIEIAVDYARPMAAAIGKIESLSGIPINYEDMPVYYSGDIRDITDEVARTPLPSGRRIMGRRRGQLSAPIVVDATTGRLNDLQAVRDALSNLVSAYNASGLPGGFDFEFYSGVFFVKPVRYRDGSGATQTMTPVLSVPVTFPQEARSIEETWRLILAPVESAIGGHVGGGGDPGVDVHCLPPPAPAPNSGVATGQVRLRPGCSVTFGAQNEPASHVIARFIATTMCINSGNTACTPPHNSSETAWDVGMSYSLLFSMTRDITGDTYVLNVHQVANSPWWKMPPPKPRPAPSPQPQVGFPSRVP